MRLLGACLTTLFLLSLTGCLPPPAPTIVASGDFGGETVWQGEIVVRGDVVFSAGSVLRILPGTVIRFDRPTAEEDRFRDHPHFPGSELIIQGRIIADGEPDAPIRLGPGSGSAGPGRWGGVNVMGSPEARFSYCLFEGADSALHAQESTLFVRESIFRDNLVGIRFHSSSIDIRHNDIVRNQTGIRFHFGAPTIRENRLVGNRTGLFLTSYPRDYFIAGNNLVDNLEYNIVLGEEVPDEVQVSGNWWGTTEVAIIERSLFDGRVESHLGRVRFQPLAQGPVAGAGASWKP